MNVKEFRSVLQQALEKAGFVPGRLARGAPVALMLPGSEVVPIFYLLGDRRPWGFWFTGFAGLEVPPLREWIERHHGSDGLGRFRRSFVEYHTLNDPLLL